MLLIIHILFVITSVQQLLVSSYELCNGEEYVNGKWVEDENLWQDSSQNFLCCGYENFNNKNLSHVCKGGLLIEDHGCTCMVHHLMKSKHFSQHYIGAQGIESDYRYEPNSVKYRWQPEKCELPKWNAYKFCNVLGKKKVLIIGDSTSNQMAAVTRNMIAQANISDNSLYECTHKINFIFSDCLVTYENKRKGCGRGASIANDIIYEGSQGHFYDIIIIGTFHMVGFTKALNYSVTDPRFGDAEFVKISQNIGIARRYYLDMGHTEPIFIYKTASLPHSNCHQKYDKGAILTPSGTDLSDLLSMNSKGLGSKYHWVGEARLENGIIDGIAKKDDISIIRMFPLINRPDGHPPEGLGDCLHYCAPGM